MINVNEEYEIGIDAFSGIRWSKNPQFLETADLGLLVEGLLLARTGRYHHYSAHNAV